uniref:Transmembrane protein n=1 Tax=Steinernema glaseri TaxID=37863 RepID=A0A1I8AU55_9BILA
MSSPTAPSHSSSACSIFSCSDRFLRQSTIDTTCSLGSDNLEKRIEDFLNRGDEMDSMGVVSRILLLLMLLIVFLFSAICSLVLFASALDMSGISRDLLAIVEPYGSLDLGRGDYHTSSVVISTKVTDKSKGIDKGVEIEVVEHGREVPLLPAGLPSPHAEKTPPLQPLGNENNPTHVWGVNTHPKFAFPPPAENIEPPANSYSPFQSPLSTWQNNFQQGLGQYASNGFPSNVPGIPPNLLGYQRGIDDSLKAGPLDFNVKAPNPSHLSGWEDNGFNARRT